MNDTYGINNDHTFDDDTHVRDIADIIDSIKDTDNEYDNQKDITEKK